MCATKPSMSWPHSPSRSSSSDWALLGIRSSPRHGLAPGHQLGTVGVRRDRDRPGVGHRHRAPSPSTTTRVTPQPLEDLAHRAGERLPAVVRLRSVQQEVRRAAAVVQQSDHQPRRVVGLVVVPHERHRRPAGPVVVELVDVEGRHDRARAGARRGRRGAGPRGRPRCRRRGTRRGPAPSSGRDPRQLGDLVDDVHESVGGHPSSFSDTPQGGDMACVGAAAAAEDPEVGQPGDHGDHGRLQLGGSPSSSSSASSSSACDIWRGVGSQPGDPLPRHRRPRARGRHGWGARS